MHEELAFYWKGGFDDQLSDNFRLRATLSGYHAKNHHFGSLYNGDRTGSRYYLIMNLQKFSPDDVDPAKNHMSGNWGPGFTDKQNYNEFAIYGNDAGFKGVMFEAGISF